MTARTYLVGGAVRDELLGLPVKDRDWVVVGATADEMLDAGYTQVGRDFPVFLHPQTNEQYALARTERKQGIGHTGFAVHAAPDVTLDQDLRRRDLTINAMAKDQQGRIIDPFGGQADLAGRLLRHVSDAFAEDPLRVFRVARFAAALPEFDIAPETMALMKAVVVSGEVESLSSERVWSETARALEFDAYHRYFAVLQDCGAAAVWFAELTARELLPIKSANAAARFAMLPLTLADFSSMARRLGVPKQTLQMAQDRVRYEVVLKNIPGADVELIVDLFEHLGVQHSTQRLAALLDTLAVDANVALTLAGEFAQVKLPADTPARGAAYGAALRQARMDRLAKTLADQT